MSVLSYPGTRPGGLLARALGCSAAVRAQQRRLYPDPVTTILPQFERQNRMKEDSINDTATACLYAYAYAGWVAQKLRRLFQRLFRMGSGS